MSRKRIIILAKATTPVAELDSLMAVSGRTITLSGYIGFGDLSALEVVSALNELEKTKEPITAKLMNLYGGSVNEGVSIFNAFKNSPCDITTVCDGLVASMGAMIFLSGKTRLMANYSRLMLHPPSVIIDGTAAQLRESAAELDGYENDLVEMVCTQTGKDAAEVKATWIVSGKDVYINQANAVACGLATGVITGTLKKDLPKNVLEHSNPKAVAAFYAKQIENSKPQPTDTMTIKAKTAARLKVEATADVATIVAAFEAELEAVDAANAELKTNLETLQTEVIDTVVDTAVEQNKITKAQAAEYKTLAKADLKAVKAIFGSIEAHVPASARIIGGDGVVKNPWEDKKYEGFTFKDFQAKAPQALVVMQAKDPAKYLAFKKESYPSATA